MKVGSGLDQLLSRPSVLRGSRLGLVANPASVTKRLEPAAIALAAAKGLRLRALFGPEHGVWADAQDLIEVDDSRDARTGLPVHSLYGQTRVATPEMLAGLDAVVFDMQDVGARYYTFVYTLLHMLEACARAGRRVVVLDRPNPLGGVAVEGNVLDPAFASFVGLHPLPVRHGLTVGELALLFREERALDVDLTVIRMKGWRRAMDFEATGLPWVMPSPNMPTVDTAFVYPGLCLIDPWALARDLDREEIPGASFRPVFFRPTFQKHAGQTCGGVQVHVLDRRRFPAYLAYLLLIFHARRQNPRKFAWRKPPYEYETVKLPIDILCGTDHIRRTIERGTSPRTLEASWREDAAAFRRRRRRFLLY